MNRRILTIALCTGLSLANPASAATTVTVDQKNLKFSIPMLKISKGDSVEFKNSDDTSHNITIAGPDFVANSGLQGPGEPFKAPLVRPGVYKVSCAIHPNMRMTIVVQ
jgi:cytochrome c peroxidase